MKLTALVCTALLVTAVAFAQTAQPLTQKKHLVPPEPRDGEGTGTTIAPILIFHAIRPYVEGDTTAVRRYIATPQTLEEELAYLHNAGYSSITFDQLAAHITADAPLPPKPVVISFDDDWENQYTYAFPLLKKYGFTATFYIWVAVVGMKHHMTWEEIKTLADAGMQIGCHTIHHPYLTRIEDETTLRREIHGAKNLIEARIGVPVTTLAYPFGQYDERVVAAVKEAGFTTARTTWPGVIHSQEGLYSLTGLIRTESEPSLIALMETSLAEANKRVDGTVVPDVHPPAPMPMELRRPPEQQRPVELKAPARLDAPGQPGAVSN